MSRSSHASFFRYISEGSVTIVVIKSATQRMWRFVDVGRRRLDEEKIHEAVLVIVYPTDTRAHGFKVIPFLGLSRILKKSDSGGLSNIGVANGYSRVLHFRSLLSSHQVNGNADSNA